MPLAAGVLALLILLRNLDRSTPPGHISGIDERFFYALMIAFGSTGNWTREQSLLAFQFYCETPFGQLHAKNRNVIELAELIGRTSGALAMKCVNFASLDPAIRDSGRSGLGNVSSLDREIWSDFHANWTGLVSECEQIRFALQNERGTSPRPEAEFLLPEEFDFAGETRTALVQQRVKQDFFRRSVLSSYGSRCCISGVTDKRFLVASHIVAWRDDKSIRLHPANGLCLSTIHDRAFDSHLFSLTDDKRIILSDQLRNTNDEFLRHVFLPIDGRPISLPEKFSPEVAFITRHRQMMLNIE
jgi:putative restriction endonuclease